MIRTIEELNLSVKKARLLTKAELADYQNQMPAISMWGNWWLADGDGYGDIAYAEGNYTDDSMSCSPDEPNTLLRVALDIEGDINAGDEFIFCGYVFTALSEELAISNNFNGCVKYFDEEMVDEDDDCTINAVINTMFMVEDSADYYDCDIDEAVEDDEECEEADFDYNEDIEMLCPYCEADIKIAMCKDGDRIKCAVCEKTFTINAKAICPDCGETVFYDSEFDRNPISCDSCGCEFDVEFKDENDDDGAIISIALNDSDAHDTVENDDDDDFSMDDLLAKYSGK
jgi:hypothetical protein